MVLRLANGWLELQAGDAGKEQRQGIVNAVELEQLVLNGEGLAFLLLGQRQTPGDQSTGDQRVMVKIPRRPKVRRSRRVGLSASSRGVPQRSRAWA